MLKKKEDYDKTTESINSKDEEYQQTHNGNIIIEDGNPDLSLSNISRYFFTRIPTLFAIKSTNLETLNPINGLHGMTLRNWNYFFLGMFGWLSASFDFFCTSVAGTQIAKSLDVSTSDITWGLSAVLMVRSAGAIIFGLWTDNYSRKWPFIFCCGMFVALQIGTGFVSTYVQFLACRGLSGVCMGGIYAASAATSLDDAPVKARSFLSGLFFTAYSMGLIFATIFWRAFQDTKHSWRALFWFSSSIPAILIIWRLLFPETQYFQKSQKAKELIKQDQIKAGVYVEPTFNSKSANFGGLIQKHWVMFVYLILLMTGPNYLTHASQDLYPSMLRQQLGFSENAITVAVVVSQLGACVGSLCVGIIMEILGRRLSIIICCILCGCFVYPAWMIQTSPAVLGGGFAVFFAVMGVWGAIPVHLSELSPPDARALFSGLSYQLGNLASSAASTIETDLSNKYPLEVDSNGDAIKFDYAKVMSILTGAVAIYTLIITFVGPEHFHRDLSSPIMKKYMEKVDQLEKDKEYGVLHTEDVEVFEKSAVKHVDNSKD
ncbi:Carboxylic acid transporter protein [Wickerhamomyces ciferrii]|uniref:Carboxylic acid transporter protein n=1 Tax=Wickerhamomyces ciferrii (strain ATCC 14091 / BCRC 22168 / CBS 111 / JCM 3599 / NBRC 0793 / NRRL Y-1031 F-60-10) TaxID=1206466 RepID=K0KE18_WICCF|nr:Carboxylic acid transporter protein [Wickerhamomyces ciferrii]CCH43335.1 Carboxylic acid transporter protein [Wickerhamomyces ciferrii]